MRRVGRDIIDRKVRCVLHRFRIDLDCRYFHDMHDSSVSDRVTLKCANLPYSVAFPKTTEKKTDIR